jgi:hypothetical protein
MAITNIQFIYYGQDKSFAGNPMPKALPWRKMIWAATRRQR